MRSPQTVYKEIQKAGQLSDDLSVRPRSFFDTKSLANQAQLVGILRALAWVTGVSKDSPVDELLKHIKQDSARSAVRTKPKRGARQ